MKKSLFQTIKSAFNLSYLILIVLFCFAIATSFMSINYMAKYSSVSNGSDGTRAARFVIDAKEVSGNNLSMIPSDSGAFTAYEFTVSNNDGANTSEVGQYYATGIIVPFDKAIEVVNYLGTFDEIKKGDLGGVGWKMLPIMIRSSDLDITLEEAVGAYTAYMNTGTALPDGLEFYFDYKTYAYSEYVELTWYENDDIKAFEFDAQDKKEYKHFILFAGFGKLSEGESYDLSGMQVVVYSEQKN